MKINFKHVAATAMAVAMSLSLSVSALAEGTDVTNGSLTVTGDQLAGKYVYAIQMFEAHALNHGTEEDPRYTYDSYTLNEKWLTFFSDEKNISKQEWVAAGVIADTDDAIEDYSDAAVEYLQYLAEDGNKMKVPAFAEKAQDWAEAEEQKVFTRNLDGETGKVKSVSVAAGWKAEYKLAEKVGDDETKGSATFDALTAGYYLVYPEGGSTGINEPDFEPDTARGTDAMLLNIPNEQHQSWNIKSTFPTVDKTVEDNNENTTGDGANGSAQVGDTVTFTLTSKVPDMSDYQDDGDKFYFAFNDTLSNGLEFVKKAEDVAVTDVTVTIGGQSVTEGYTVSLTGNKLCVVFNDLKSVSGADVGDAIVVTYQAMITEAAATTTNPVTNTVEVEYSNDPNSTSHGTSTPDESKVYTYKIDVNKWASDIANGKAGNLAGAEFILSTSATAPTAEEIEGDYTAYKGLVKLNGIDKAYRVAKPGEKSVNSFITVDSGDTTISGLEAGTYYLHEVAAPSGYNKLKKPITIVIAVKDYTTGAATITVNGTAVSGDSTVVDVENKKGITLPETGSIGTIGLTVAGVAIVLLGVFAPRKKKKGNQE